MFDQPWVCSKVCTKKRLFLYSILLSVLFAFTKHRGILMNAFWLLIQQICWAITPLILIVIFGFTIYHWTPPTYGGVVFYPDWAHGIGWFLTLIVALQIPLGAIIALVYYSIKGRPLDAFRPSPDWGPGDKVGKQEWIEYKQTKALTCKRHPFMSHAHVMPPPPQMGYDNFGMYYPNAYYSSGPGSYHM